MALFGGVAHAALGEWRTAAAHWAACATLPFAGAWPANMQVAAASKWVLVQSVLKRVSRGTPAFNGRVPGAHGVMAKPAAVIGDGVRGACLKFDAPRLTPDPPL